jgi:hypothetical protein
VPASRYLALSDDFGLSRRSRRAGLAGGAASPAVELRPGESLEATIILQPWSRGPRSPGTISQLLLVTVAVPAASAGGGASLGGWAFQVAARRAVALLVSPAAAAALGSLLRANAPPFVPAAVRQLLQARLRPVVPPPDVQLPVPLELVGGGCTPLLCG